jgi:hypothetical protein
VRKEYKERRKKWKKEIKKFTNTKARLYKKIDSTRKIL